MRYFQAALFFICTTVIAISATTFADDLKDRFLLEGSNHYSDNYKGQSFHAIDNHSVDSENDIQLGAENLTRTYSDQTHLQDTIFNLGYISKGGNSYLETQLTGSSSAEIYSKWSALVNPHLLVSNNDVGLGFKYAEYKQSKDFTLNPSALYSFTDDVGVGGAAFIVYSTDLIAAYQILGRWKFLDRHSLRFTGAGGRTIEDAGLEANFTSWTGQYFYNFTPVWRVEFTYIDYHSDVRKEQSFGIGLGYR